MTSEPRRSRHDISISRWRLGRTLYNHQDDDHIPVRPSSKPDLIVQNYATSPSGYLVLLCTGSIRGFRVVYKQLKSNNTKTQLNIRNSSSVPLRAFKHHPCDLKHILRPAYLINYSYNVRLKI